MIRIRHVEGTPTAIERRICSDAADVGANQIEKHHMLVVVVNRIFKVRLVGPHRAKLSV
jgi:hypothetical protein